MNLNSLLMVRMRTNQFYSWCACGRTLLYLLLVPYPDHPQVRFREKCGTPLMKSVCSADGKQNLLYPIKVYSYQPLKLFFQNLIKSKDILQNMLNGPIKSQNGIMFDTADGRFWHDFKDSDNKPFFEDKRNIGGILNIDWFEPFDNIQYSCGVIYIAILNLPRDIRLKWENILIVGIIPGPKETNYNVNTFLKPLVDDLLVFWDGVWLQENATTALYKFALCCISSDLPATRKCCSFVSYNALHGEC